jgi:Zn-dependent protease with chaperone function
MISVPALLGRKSGRLDVYPDRLIFVLDDVIDGMITLDPRTSKIWIGGTNSTHFFIQDPRFPEQSLSFQDVRVLEYLAAEGIAEARSALNMSQQRHRLRLAVWTSPALIVLFLVFLIPLISTIIPIRWLNGTLSLEQEKKLGQLVLQSYFSGHSQDSKPTPQEQALLKMVEFIQQRNPSLKGISFEIHISDSQEVNAFALPGGVIVFNRGLIDRAKTIEEVFGVLSHEMAHIERRHSLKSLAGGIGRVLGVGVITVFLGSDIGAWFARGSEFVSLNYSRDDESEADRRGYEFLQQAQIDPHGLIQFFKRLKEQELGQGRLGSVLTLLSTHPASDDRVLTLRDLLAKNPFEFDRRYPVELKDIK